MIPVTTPAGTFRTRRVEKDLPGRGRVILWLSSDVPVMHIAKMESFVKGYRQLLAVRVAHDGRSVFPAHYTVRSMASLGEGVQKAAEQLLGPGSSSKEPEAPQPKIPESPDGGLRTYVPPAGK